MATAAPTEEVKTAVTPAATPTPTPVTPESAAKAHAFLRGTSGGNPPVETEADKAFNKAQAESDAAKKKTADDAQAEADKKAAAEKKPEAKPEKKEDKAAPAKIAPAKRIIRKAGEPAEPSADATKLADAANKLATAAEKMGEATKLNPAVAPAEPELNPKETYELAVLAKAEEVFADNPSYKGIVGRAKKYMAELPSFQKDFDKGFEEKWIRKNANKEFESDEARDSAFNLERDAEFTKKAEEFKGKFNIAIDDVDFQRAASRLEMEPLTKELEATRKQLAALTGKENEERVTAAAKEKSSAAIADIAERVELIGEEFKGALNEDGTVNEEKLKDMPDGDIVSEALTDAAQRARNFAEDVAFYLAGPQKDTTSQVYKFCVHLEEVHSKNQTKLADGTTFATGAEYSKMSKAEREKHWILDTDTIISMGNDTIMREAKEIIDAERAKTTARIERRGLQPKVAPAAPAKAASVKPQSPASVDPTPPATAPAPSNSNFTMDFLRGRVKT